MLDFGVDTVRFGHRHLTKSDARAAFADVRPDAITGEAVRPVRMRGRSVQLHSSDPERVGVAYGWNTHALVWTEARLAEFVHDDSPLAPLSFLPAGELASRRLLERRGVPVDGSPATLCRCDLAVDVGFERPEDGAAFLRAVDRVELPPYKSCVHREGSVVETVAYHLRGSIQLRVYDKSAEQGEVAGTRVRIEREWRPKYRSQQPSPREFGLERASAVFRKPYRNVALDRLVVADGPDFSRLVLDRTKNTLEASKVIGQLVILQNHGDAPFTSRRAAQEARRFVRSFGIELDASLRCSIDVGAVFALAVRQWGTS